MAAWSSVGCWRGSKRARCLNGVVNSCDSTGVPRAAVMRPSIPALPVPSTELVYFCRVADSAQSVIARAPALGGRVKYELCQSNPHVQSVLVHMEPFVRDDRASITA